MLSGEYGHVKDLAGHEQRPLDGPEDFNNWLREEFHGQPVQLVITGRIRDEDGRRTYYPFRMVTLYPDGHDCQKDGTGSCEP